MLKRAENGSRKGIGTRVAGTGLGSSFRRSLSDGSWGRNWARHLGFGLRIVAAVASVL